MQTQSDSQSQLTRLLAQYRTLSDYCDAFWRQVSAALPAELLCRKGCAICCELQSVNALEAWVISKTWNPLQPSTAQCDPNRCPFLRDEQCRIYDSRPTICRTHGLLLRSETFQSPAVSCPYNFQTCAYDKVDESLQLDIDRITSNLARLNIAFCTINGTPGLASQRIALADLFRGGELPFAPDTVVQQ